MNSDMLRQLENLDPQQRLLFDLLTSHFDEKLQTCFKALNSSIQTSVQSIVNSAEDRLDEKIDMLNQKVEDNNKLLRKHISTHP